jgi:hypothetical protein
LAIAGIKYSAVPRGDQAGGLGTGGGQAAELIALAARSDRLVLQPSLKA